MAITSLPPGFRFHPTDVELVKYYLKKKVLGKRFPIDAIAEVDIYKFAPWDLPGKACLSTRDRKWYFFCPHGRKYATGSRTNRATDFGFWKTTGKDRPVMYNSQPVGMIKSLIFHRRGAEPKPERTNWVMHEYRLEDEDLKTKGVVQDAFVICMIFEKDGPGPRNGAQYGAPFNEEEWDDDEEADVPSTSSFTQAFILPDKQKQTVDIRITGSEQYCGASTSKACPAGPSQIAPSVVNMPPPALPNDVTMEDPLYFLSHGISGDEIPAASSENDKVENLDHINPDGNNQAEHTVDYVSDGLDVFDGLEEFVELKDLDAPLNSVNGPGPSGHNYSDSCLSAYDHSIAALSFGTPGVPDDANAPGLGLEDLEVPLTCFSEATQSNQAYVGDSFCDLGGNNGLCGFGTSNPPFFAQPFHGSDVTHIAEDFPCLSQCLQLEPSEGYVDNHQEGYGVEERTNLEIGAATSPINNLDLGCARACENSGRGRFQFW